MSTTPPSLPPKSPTPPTATSKGAPPKSWNHCCGFVGIPECGKSTVALFRAMQLAQETPLYIIAHDPEYALPRRLPDGRATNVRHYETVAAAARGIGQSAGGVHAVTCLDALEVVKFAHRVGEQSLTKAKGGAAPPVICIVDEVTNCKEMGPMWLGPTLQAALVMRRHRHCALFWTTQDPALVNRQFLSKTTELYVFRLEDEAGIDRLVKLANFPRASAAQIKTLKQYDYLLHKTKGFKDGD